LLNNKEYSDIIFVLSLDERDKEMFVNKKVMFNFSLPLKNIMINYSQNSNYFNFHDFSFIGVYNSLKFIYSNFNENLNNLDMEIINEMIDIIIKYRAKALLLIVLDRLTISNENVLSLYELALKHNLEELKTQTYSYIGENLDYLFKKEKNVEESFGLKKLLFENYFCSHSITIQANCLGFDIKNITSTTLSSENLMEIKDICKNNKMTFCLNCKKIIQ
jgi:hypothetical protein